MDTVLGLLHGMHNRDLVVGGGIHSLMFAANLCARLEVWDDGMNDTLYLVYGHAMKTLRIYTLYSARCDIVARLKSTRSDNVASAATSACEKGFAVRGSPSIAPRNLPEFADTLTWRITTQPRVHARRGLH